MFRRLVLYWFAGLWIAPTALAEKSSILVVAVAGINAYAETLAGIREQIPDVQVVDARDEGGLRERLNAQPPPTLAIALGSEAAMLLDRIAPPRLPVVKSVLLEWNMERGSAERPSSAAIAVDMDPSALFNELKLLFPDKVRIGVIRGPTQTEAYMRKIEQAARQLGFTIEIRDCREARDVVKILLEFQSVDFVWCLPDLELYNSATLKPLLIASITKKLPIIGFSEQFAEAGALFGGGPDFRDVGRQTADVALRVLRHQPVAAKLEARKFHFAYNQRVARLVGVKATAPEQRGSGLNIIR
jgi:putative ABC transport system substrate-binding protein